MSMIKALLPAVDTAGAFKQACVLPGEGSSAETSQAQQQQQQLQQQQPSAYSHAHGALQLCALFNTLLA
jgi:hypothetical protein